MELNTKIQQLRKQKGLTQEELAAALYVSRTAISKWESGRGYPGIDSLKAIAKFFHVSVDELLSGEELLTVAEADNRQKQSRIRDLVYGLLDLSGLLLLFLPLFGQRAGEQVQPVSLPVLVAAPYLCAAFWSVAIAMAVVGILTLALQNCQRPLWLRLKSGMSLILNAIGALVFVVSLQPYAAVFLCAVLAIKVFLLLKKG